MFRLAVLPAVKSSQHMAQQQQSLALALNAGRPCKNLPGDCLWSTSVLHVGPTPSLTLDYASALGGSRSAGPVARLRRLLVAFLKTQAAGRPALTDETCNLQGGLRRADSCT